MSESDVSDSKHEECGDPAPGPGKARPGRVSSWWQGAVATAGWRCWRLQLGWEAGAGSAAAAATPPHLFGYI